MCYSYQITTDEEDAYYIIEGINNGEINNKFYWLTDNEEELLDEYIVWKPDLNGKVIINNLLGNLTYMGIKYIEYIQRKKGKYNKNYF
jgi:hypothetical protein